MPFIKHIHLKFYVSKLLINEYGEERRIFFYFLGWYVLGIKICELRVTDYEERLLIELRLDIEIDEVTNTDSD